MEEGGLDLIFTAQFLDDGAVHRTPVERVVAQDAFVGAVLAERTVRTLARLGFVRVRLYLHLSVEPRFEVVSNIGYLHRRVILVEKLVHPELIHRLNLDGSGESKEGLRFWLGLFFLLTVFYRLNKQGDGRFGILNHPLSV